MPSLKKLFFPFSSSRTAPKKQGSRRLTRQRKLRHVTDGRLGLSWSQGDSPSPQPLPLPEFRRGRESDQSFSERSKEDKRDESFDLKNSSLGSDRRSKEDRGDESFESFDIKNSSLGSDKERSKEVDNKGEEDRKNESFDIKNSSLCSDKSSLSPRLIDETTNHPTKKSEKPPTYFRRGVPLSLDNDNSTYNFGCNVLARSAPTSGLSSPVHNPQRFNSVDFVPSSSSSVPQLLFSPTPKEYVDRHPNTPNHSPLQSPKKKSFQNTNHHNLHPLPLPPSSPKPIPSPTNTNTCQKPDASSTKSKWIKGKLIGRGTYGTVFEAFNSETGAMCAMKEVDIMLDDPKSVECIKQLEQEIKILQTLEHTNIVQYYGCEVVEDHFCIYLEYVYPGSISKYIREHVGAITESVVRNFTCHILSGLAYLHSTDTVHRDIKGANLLVNASGVVKLADFGLAKHLTAAAYDLSLKGSPHWMAPELLQAVMRKDSDHQHAYAIDIWSLGCTIIEMFNGKPPWSECTGVQALFHVMNKSPAIPESLSSEGKDFLHWCFKRNPAERPVAAQLLKHPFVQTTREHDFSSFTLDFSGIKLADASCSPREPPSICRSLPTSPLSNGGKSNFKSSRAATHQSPRSTLEALNSISSPEFNSNSPAINSCTTSPNYLRFATRYNHQNITRKARKEFFLSFEG